MVRSYLLSLLLLLSVTSLHCMQIPRAQLTTISVLDVIKNDVCSGGLLLYSSLRTPLIISAVALLKTLYHHGASFQEIFKGVAIATMIGSSLCPMLVGYIGALMILIMGDPYNKIEFIYSQQSLRARSGLRWLCAVFQSVIALRRFKGVLAQQSADFFIKHPSLIAFQ